MLGLSKDGGKSFSLQRAKGRATLTDIVLDRPRQRLDVQRRRPAALSPSQQAKAASRLTQERPNDSERTHQPAGPVYCIHGTLADLVEQVHSRADADCHALLAVSAMRTHLDPGFNKLIPMRHEYMTAFLKHAATFSGANRILVSVEWKGQQGDIYNKEFLEAAWRDGRGLLHPGVNRGQVYSLFTPNVKYIEITEDGYVGEVLIPSRFEANEQGLAQVRSNVAKSGQIGSLVSNDLKSAMVRADLLEVDPKTGEKLDYHQVAQRLEEIRSKFEGKDISITSLVFQGAGRCDGRPDHGDDLLRHRLCHHGHHAAHLYQVHQHHGGRPGRGTAARDLAAGHFAADRLRHRPHVDPGSLSDLLHRRIPCRADDGRLEA
jgi:hypothetical protein